MKLCIPHDFPNAPPKGARSPNTHKTLTGAQPRSLSRPPR